MLWKVSQTIATNQNSSELIQLQKIEKYLVVWFITLYSHYSYSLHFPIEQACYVMLIFVYNGVKSANKAKLAISHVKTIYINIIHPFSGVYTQHPFSFFVSKTFAMKEWVPLQNHSFLLIVILKWNFTPPPCFNTSFSCYAGLSMIHILTCVGDPALSCCEDLLSCHSLGPSPPCWPCPGSGAGCLFQVHATSPLMLHVRSPAPGCPWSCSLLGYMTW